MAKLRFYNGIGSMYSSNLISGNVQNIANGASAGIYYEYGGCHYDGSTYTWACGTYYRDYTTAYNDVMGAYAPFDLSASDTGILGFTCKELLDHRHLIQNNTSNTLYLNVNRTEYITLTVSGRTTNAFGHDCYNNASMTCRINGTTYTFFNYTASGTILDFGLFFSTDQNGNSGFFPFICMESAVNGHMTRVIYVYTNNFGQNLIPCIKALYDNYGKPQDQIPVDPDNEPTGGWSNIADLTGDNIDLPDAPDETVTGVLASGFLNIYSPSASQLRAFGGALWTNAFNVKWYDVDSISNLILNAISDPINFIVGLFMLPVTPTTSANTGIKLGGINVNTVSAPVISKQFVTLSFGSLDVTELYANYLDYSYSRLSIYLPYIGMADIDVQEVTGGSVELQYIIDCFTGACVANVKCTKITETPWGGTYTNSTVHSYSGNVAVQLPISAGSFDIMTQGLINVGLGLVSGQPQTVAKGANDVIQNVGGDATTRGALSSNTGRLCYQTPYLMFTRPIESRPASLGQLHGYSAGVGGQLKNFKGYVECSDVKLDGISATDSELNMIESLLKSGVYV